MLLNLHEFAFEGQNMELNVKMYLTCILHVREAVPYINHGYHICSRTIFFGDAAVALPREIYTFV